MRRPSTCSAYWFLPVSAIERLIFVGLGPYPISRSRNRSEPRTHYAMRPRFLHDHQTSRPNRFGIFLFSFSFFPSLSPATATISLEHARAEISCHMFAIGSKSSHTIHGLVKRARKEKGKRLRSPHHRARGTRRSPKRSICQQISPVPADFLFRHRQFFGWQSTMGGLLARLASMRSTAGIHLEPLTPLSMREQPFAAQRHRSGLNHRRAK